ncbi:unnamed protein product [Coregonus sp. 'balchen']|nr:unnamed protein product [Coregonus sp. 'balchen']
MLRCIPSSIQRGRDLRAVVTNQYKKCSCGTERMLWESTEDLRAPIRTHTAPHSLSFFLLLRHFPNKEKLARRRNRPHLSEPRNPRDQNNTHSPGPVGTEKRSIIMCSNGASNGTSDMLQIQFGLINCGNKYLTAETFGFKINASATSLKKKQIWTLEQSGEEAAGNVFCLKSHLGRYIAVDKDGNVTGDSESSGPETRFIITAHDDGRCRGPRQFGRKEDGKKLFEKGDVRLMMSEEKLHQWLKNGAFTLPCTLRDQRYHLQTSDNRFLKNDGSLEAAPDKTTGYTLEFRSGKVAFRDCFGPLPGAVGAERDHEEWEEQPRGEG